MPSSFSSYLDKKLASMILEGAVGIMPTDTLYGIVASAHKQSAVERIYKVKQRWGKPGTIIASSVEQLASIGIEKSDIDKAKNYWPGCVSVILPVNIEKTWLHQGTNSVAVRVIKDGELARLLNAVGPLVTSSANITSQAPITNIKEAKNVFENELDFYVDKGEIKHAEPSTIIKLENNNQVKIIRQGVVKIK